MFVGARRVLSCVVVQAAAFSCSERFVISSVHSTHVRHHSRSGRNCPKSNFKGDDDCATPIDQAADLRNVYGAKINGQRKLKPSTILMSDVSLYKSHNFVARKACLLP